MYVMYTCVQTHIITGTVATLQVFKIEDRRKQYLFQFQIFNNIHMCTGRYVMYG